MNMNALDRWCKRVLSIAKDLGQTDDESRQKSFETAITNVAQKFIDVSSWERDILPSKLQPQIHAKREEVLLQGEELLNSFQPPSPGRSQMMKNAALEDATQLKVQLKGLETVSDSVLRVINSHTTTSEATNYGMDGLHGDHTTSKKQRSHTRLVLKLDRLNAERSTESYIVVGISDMTEGAEVDRYLISFEDTFSDLVETILDSDNAADLPDFWCKRHDSSKNQATDSGMWWECQVSNRRVVEAILEEKRIATRGEEAATGMSTEQERRNVEIRSVLKDGEYLVALVGKDGVESGVPVGIPRSHRQPAAAHFQEKVFPNDRVAKVLLLESGADASPMIFDNRLFPHKSNPLFVELQAARRDGGKGKETAG